MQIPTFLKRIFSIPMILLYVIVYHFRFEIMILILQLYTSFFSYGKAFTERMIGEFYFSQSHLYAQEASSYFHKSMDFYKAGLEKAEPSKRGQMEFLIGSQYECGKGVKADVQEAKRWYEAAVKHGYSDAGRALDQLDQMLKKSQGHAKPSDLIDLMKNRCLPPETR